MNHNFVGDFRCVLLQDRNLVLEVKRILPMEIVSRFFQLPPRIELGLLDSKSSVLTGYTMGANEMSRAGFEPARLASYELESYPLDHSGTWTYVTV
jgi:hypothetical protein